MSGKGAPCLGVTTNCHAPSFAASYCFREPKCRQSRPPAQWFPKDDLRRSVNRGLSVAGSFRKGLLMSVRRLLHWFERSAHNLPFDEPRLFNERIVQAILSIEQGSAQ